MPSQLVLQEARKSMNGDGMRDPPMTLLLLFAAVTFTALLSLGLVFYGWFDAWIEVLPTIGRNHRTAALAHRRNR
jgi:hypothetical protein